MRPDRRAKEVGRGFRGVALAVGGSSRGWAWGPLRQRDVEECRASQRNLLRPHEVLSRAALCCGGAPATSMISCLLAVATKGPWPHSSNIWQQIQKVTLASVAACILPCFNCCRRAALHFPAPPRPWPPLPHLPLQWTAPLPPPAGDPACRHPGGPAASRLQAEQWFTRGCNAEQASCCFAHCRTRHGRGRTQRHTHPCCRHEGRDRWRRTARQRPRST